MVFMFNKYSVVTCIVTCTDTNVADYFGYILTDEQLYDCKISLRTCL